MKSLVSCLAIICLATVFALPAGAAQPPLTPSAGPPADAVQSGGSFPAPLRAHGNPNGVSTQAALGGTGCTFFASPPAKISSTAIFFHAQFNCNNVYAPILSAHGCIYFYQPNNYVWYTAACNATGWHAGTDLTLAITSGNFGCHTYAAWGNFYGTSPFNGSFGGGWSSPAAWIC